MLDERRQFTRFDIPLILEFKPANGDSKYAWGLTRNFSVDGFCFETRDANFEPQKNMEFKLKFPQRGTFVSVAGNIVWKKYVEDRYTSGVEFREVNEKFKKELLKKVCDYGNIPLDEILHRKKPGNIMMDKSEEKHSKILRNLLGRDKKQLKKSHREPDTAGIKKQYLKSGSVCKVTFRLPKEAAPDAESITIVGEFNDWNPTKTLMQKTDTGDFTLVLELPSKREYRFRYLINGTRWENDWHADNYLPNPFGGDDSVVAV